MGVVVRLFFLMILSSIVLSMALGWLAIFRAKLHFDKLFGTKPRQNTPKQPDDKTIEGEYRVLSDDENK